MKFNLFFFVSIFYLIRPTYSFKSYFEYHQQIYLNASSWVVQLQHNYSKMEISASNLVDICEDAPIALNEMKDKIKTIATRDFSPEYKVIPRRYPFKQARQECQLLGKTCDMATINSYDEQETVRILLNQYAITRAYINYHTHNGFLYGSQDKVTNTSYISSKEFHLHACPEHSQAVELDDDVVCIRTNNENSYRHQNEQKCNNFQSSLYRPKSMTHLEKVVKGTPSIQAHNYYYWLGGKYSKTDLPDVKACTQSGGHNMYAYYDHYYKCVSFTNTDYQYPGICASNGKIKDVKLNEPKFIQLMHTNYKLRPAAVTFNSHDMKYTLDNDRLSFPTICKCNVQAQHTHLRDHFKLNLVAKVDSAVKTIHQKCNSTLNPIHNSPYIVTQKVQDLNRHKRMALTNVVMSAFRSVGSALSGFARATGNVGRNVANSARNTVGPTFARAKTFLPSLKKTAYLTTSASAVGVSALALDQYLRESSFHDDRTNNFTEHIRNSFDALEFDSSLSNSESEQLDFINHNK